MIKYKKWRTGHHLIPVTNSPMHQHTGTLRAFRRGSVIAYKHIIPKDIRPHPDVSGRKKQQMVM
jgi:hypothetical protein